VKHFTIAIALLTASACIFAEAARAQTGLFVGRWKLNVTKSKFISGPLRTSETRILVPSPEGLKVNIKLVNDDGSIQEFEYTASLNGKTYHISGQGPYGADAIAASFAAPNAFESILKRDGKIVAKSTTVVSADGKVLTIATKGKDDSGNQFVSIAVYDRQ
jgi:hypothetical protein